MQTNGMRTMQKETKTYEKGVIYSTDNLDIFKGIIGNRGIYAPHLQRLTASITEDNMLSENPIIVNENMEVVDGQHRLLAAKALGLPIYFVVKSEADLHQVQMLNANNRAWALEDYLDSFIAMGARDYIRLAEFAEEYKISVPIALSILADDYEHRNNVLRDFKTGKFTIRNYEKSENMASLITEIRRFSPDNCWADRELQRALEVMVAKIDPKKFITMLRTYNLAVTRRTSVKEYLAELSDILSYKQAEEVRL